MTNINSIQDLKNNYYIDGKYKLNSAFGNCYFFGIIKNKTTNRDELVCLEFMNFIAKNQDLIDLLVKFHTTKEWIELEDLDVFDSIIYSKFKLYKLNYSTKKDIDIWKEILNMYENSDQYKSSLMSTKFPNDNQAIIIDRLYNYTYYEVERGDVSIVGDEIKLEFETTDIHGGVDKILVEFTQITDYKYNKTKFEHSFIFDWEYTPNYHKILFPNFELEVNCFVVNLTIQKESGELAKFEGINMPIIKHKKFLGIF